MGDQQRHYECGNPLEFCKNKVRLRLRWIKEMYPTNFLSPYDVGDRAG